MIFFLGQEEQSCLYLGHNYMFCSVQWQKQARKKYDKSSDFLQSAFMSTAESVDASESAEMAFAAQQPV